MNMSKNHTRDNAISSSPSLKEDYMLKVETRGSQSLLNIDVFKDPTSYQLNVKKQVLMNISNDQLICLKPLTT